MGYYRIEAILHSGSQGERNTPRTDGRYSSRIGRIVDIGDKDIIGMINGKCLLLHYITDENGNSCRHKDSYLLTTCVVDVLYAYEKRIIAETENSIYEFEKVEGL